jgi:hypothetical protein
MVKTMSRYFDELDFLYENLRLLEADRQLEIAETGADVNEPGLDSDQAQGQEQPPEQPMDGGQDMDNAA